MARTDQRSVVLAATLVAVHLPMPEWLAQAFDLVRPQQPGSQGADPAKLSAWRREQLRTAAATARIVGKPLLVLLVPEGVPSHAVGLWFGSFLVHGSDAAMGDVSLCTLACARADEVKSELELVDESLVAPASGVGLLLVEPIATEAKQPAKVTQIAVELELSFPPPPKPREFVEHQLAERAWREVGLAKIATALRDGLQRHGVDRARLAANALAALRDAERQQVEAWLRDGGNLEPATLKRASAWLQQRVAALPEERRLVRTQELGTALRTLLQWQQPSGSVWGDWSCPPCGRGHVPPLCARFLDFYTRPAEPK
ncbi:MAG: hypothetical protein JNL12_04765 [Planctomycetes bacterium]|nr:hypothetical protein [Planctomycetota bacterium]